MERIGKSDYHAKTDHMRRLLERTKVAGVRKRRQSWKNALLWIGGLAWWISILLEMYWHMVGARVDGAFFVHDPDMLRVSQRIMSPFTFIGSCVRADTRESDCYSTATFLAGVSLRLAAGSIWWNPKLIRKSKNPNVRLNRLADYYILQVLLLAIRVGGFFVLDKAVKMGVDIKTQKLVHMVLFAIITVVSR
jgi:hypothetical protein